MSLTQTSGLVFEHLPLGICLLDGAQRMVDCNPAFRVLFGLANDFPSKNQNINDLLRTVSATPLKHPLSASDIQELSLADGRIIDIKAHPLPQQSLMIVCEDVTAQRARETRLQAMLKLSSDWVWECNTEHRFTEMVGSCFSISGRPPEWFVGKTFEASFPTTEWDFDDLIAHLDRGEGFRDKIVAFTKPEGGTVYLSWNGEPIRNSHGALTGFRGNGQNVTTRITAEIEAIKYKDQLVAAIEGLSEGFAYFGPDDRLELCNSKFRENFDKTAPAIIVGKRFEDIVRFGLDNGQFDIPEGEEEAFLAKRIRFHQTAAEPMELRLKDGRWLNIVECRTKEGGTVGIQTDITHLKVLEQRLLDAIEAMRDGFALWDAENRLILCNAAYKTMCTGFADQVHPGISFSDFARLIFEHRVLKTDQTYEDWLTNRSDERRRKESLFEQHLTDGRHFLCFDRRTGEGGTVSIRTDITELINTQHELTERQMKLAAYMEELEANAGHLEQVAEELQKERDKANTANMAKSQFLATMSHELRTPLNAILGFSDVIKTQTFGPVGSTYIDYASHIHDSGHRLLSLINDILDMSRIEAGRYEISPEQCVPEQLVDQSLLLVEGRAKEIGVRLSKNISPGLPVCHWDRRAIEQVLLNLLTNAVKFTLKGGTITISVDRLEHDHIRIAVADSGIGIAQDDLTNIFEPFVQAERQKRKNFHEGTGLGLSLCKSLVELHGGAIAIESTVGAGTTVTVDLPREAIGAVETPLTIMRHMHG